MINGVSSNKEVDEQARRAAEIFIEEFKPVWNMPKDTPEQIAKRVAEGHKAYKRAMKRIAEECPEYLKVAVSIVYHLLSLYEEREGGVYDERVDAWRSEN